jgi:adenylate kinase
LIIVGPPGSNRKEIALQLAEHLSEDDNFVCITVGDLLTKEINKKSELGKQIVESRKTYSYVKDEIVISLVKLQIELLEKDQKSWIIEGFPRTRQQALALQKMGIIPDKFILLHIKHQVTIEKVKKNLKSEESLIQYPDEEIDSLARSALTEYKVHIHAVKEVCKGSIIELDGNKDLNLVLEDIARNLKMNISNAPRRPPRVFLIGPPGSRKTHFALQIAQKY